MPPIDINGTDSFKTGLDYPCDEDDEGKCRYP